MLELPFAGAGGEPIDFRRAIGSHGLLFLPPGSVDAEAPSYTVRVRIGEVIRSLGFTEQNGTLRIDAGPKLRASERKAVHAIARRIFRLDDDLSPFYTAIADDAEFSWAVGAGRLLASPTVFEDVIKTICTTNCTWAGTIRMVSALVELGGGAFPDASTLAATKERWFVDVARMGYRGAYVRAIARDVRDGELDLEALLPKNGLDPQAVEERLLELPGVGPYAAAHIMQLLGYHHRLILDSATRPKYAAVAKMKRASDRTIQRRFARYGAYAGLAFWLYITRDWHE